VTPEAPTLACLLPIRNGERDLPGYLEAASRFADAVLALDDGSTDETADLLAGARQVTTVLSNPRCSGHAGWDDRENRQRLLDAAIEVGCEWAMFLDVDERIPVDDASALRQFALDGADPDHAYLFRVFRMVGDERHYDQSGLWVARMFAPRPGHELPPQRLHLVPVPTRIPASRWRRTTVRIQHLAGLTEERRRARFRKYMEADPHRRWQADYRALMVPGGRPRSWAQRPADLPVLGAGGAPAPSNGRPREAGELPVLSAVVISRDDEAVIEAAVRSVAEQQCSFPFEVIVVCSGRDGTANVVRRRLPHVRLIELSRPALPGEARNAGLRAARGEFITFPGSHIRLEPGSLEARVRAHRRGFDMVTDTVLNGTPTRSGWASYFLDHGGCLPERPSGELSGPPGHCSYVRDALVEIGGFPEGMRAGEDTVVNTTLWDRGLTAYRAGDVRIVHRSPCSGPLKLARHHFQRGRAWARITRDEISAGRGSPVRLLRMLATYGPYRLSSTDEGIRRWGGAIAQRYRSVRPSVLLGIAAAWAGVWVGALEPRWTR
jgi:glycosyltransferase involved in cell wall biosynthesis